jgi:inactivated superfamily I helicase
MTFLSAVRLYASDPEWNIAMTKALDQLESDLETTYRPVKEEYESWLKINREIQQNYHQAFEAQTVIHGQHEGDTSQSVTESYEGWLKQVHLVNATVAPTMAAARRGETNRRVGTVVYDVGRVRGSQ